MYVRLQLYFIIQCAFMQKIKKKKIELAAVAQLNFLIHNCLACDQWHWQ